MRFGVNYTPSHGWFFAWMDPDWDAISHDLDQIAGLGVDHIRIFPLWTLLQPNRSYINQKALADVRHVTQLAARRGLDVYVDVLQGHLSSFDFVPSWLVSWHEASMFADAKAVQAQAQLVKAVYGTLADEPHFRGLTLGNECNQFTDASHPRRQKADAQETKAWIAALLKPVEADAHKSGRVVLHSENDAVWYEDGHAFTPWEVSNMGDVSAIHSWVFNGVARKYGPLSFESTHHGEYLMELAKAYAIDPHRQVWLQESGAPLNSMSAEQAPQFCHETVAAAVNCPDAYGVTWWCSHDVSSSFADFPPVEYSLGLFDENGHLKPVGEAYKKTIAEHRNDKPALGGSVAVVVPSQNGNPVLRAAHAAGGSVFSAWMDLARKGEKPQIVSSELADNSDYLAARGITHLKRVQPVAGLAYEAVSDPSLSSRKAS